MQVTSDSFFYICSTAAILFFLVALWVAYLKQRAFFAQMNKLVGMHKSTNDILSHILKELRRHTKQLADIIDEAANSPAYDEAYAVESVEERFDEEPLRKVYIGNLDYLTSEEELMDLFSPYGVIESVNIPVNRYDTMKGRGYGFVTFENKQAAARAIEMNGQMFKNRALQVNFAKERD